MKEILIYKDIGDSMFIQGITAESINSQLKEAGGEDIKLRINSDGGSVFEGFAIYNLLDQYDGNIDVFIDGIAASIASLIAMAGNTISMAKNSRMMIHNAYGGVLGDADEMRKTADLLDSLTATIAETYADKTGETKDEYLALMKAETWYTAEEAVAAKLGTSVIDRQAKISNKIERPWIKNAPDTAETVAQANQAFLNIQKRKLKLLQADA